jgi:hypothetical protein
MPAATITQSTVSPTLTPLTVANAIATAMQSAGFTLIDTVNGASEIRAFKYVVNAGAAKGTAYIQLTINSTDIYYALADNYSVSGHSMTASSYSQISLQTSSPFNLIAVNHPELRMVYLSHAGYFGAIGYARPATKYNWWDENSYLYGFLIQATTFRIATLPTGSIPLASAGYSTTERLKDPPPSGGHQLIRSPFLIGATGTCCVMGQFSSDIASVPSAPLLTEFQSGSERFLTVLQNTYETCYLAVKIS